MTTQATVTCPGCKAEIRKAGLRKHQQTGKCAARTLAAMAEACGFIVGHGPSGIPDALRLWLPTNWRPPHWERGGRVHGEWWCPAWAMRLDQSLIALQGGEPDGRIYSEAYWTEHERLAKERRELILEIARKEGLTF